MAEPALRPDERTDYGDGLGNALWVGHEPAGRGCADYAVGGVWSLVYGCAVIGGGEHYREVGRGNRGVGKNCKFDSDKSVKGWCY